MGIPSAIITDLTSQIQFKKIINFRLDQYFDYIVTSEEAGCDKPAKAIYDLALNKTSYQSGLIWMIGDDPEKDTKGSKDAINAITLEKDGGIIDIIGKVGEDPGSAWTDDATAGYTDANGGTWWTKRQTLVRKSSVKKGVTMNPIVFNPTLEWDSLPDGTYSGLGSHNCDCISSTNISEGENESFVVYPNPANIGDNIVINTYNKIDKVVVYDISGKSLLVNKINNNKLVFPTNTLSSGSYILKAWLDTGSIVEHKIIIR